MKPKLIAVFVALVLAVAAVAPVSAQSDSEQITFVFMSQTGNEYRYTLLGPDSKVWSGSVHGRGTAVVQGPPGMYGYTLDGPGSNQHVGHIGLLAGGRAEVIFTDFFVTERVDKRAPLADTGTTTTTATTDQATFVFTSQTGNEYSYTLLGPESNVWVGAVHRRASSTVQGPPGLYGYTLDGRGSNQFAGHVTILAGGRAEIVFDDFGLTERVTNPAPAPASEPSTSTVTYTVQPGDSLTKIAKKYDVDPLVLAAANGISDPNVITPGQVLQIEVNRYRVRSGDSLSRIARLFGVSLDELAALNNITDANVIFIGQQLEIPK